MGWGGSAALVRFLVAVRLGMTRSFCDAFVVTLYFTLSSRVIPRADFGVAIPRLMTFEAVHRRVVAKKSYSHLEKRGRPLPWRRAGGLHAQ